MFSTKDHWDFFAEFCRYELKSGGPDPQLAMVHVMSVGCVSSQEVWRAGLYIAVYNVAFAEALWCAWPWDRMVREPKKLRLWLDKNWPKIVTRVERRCVRRSDWMEQFLLGYALFAKDYPGLEILCRRLGGAEAYNYAWDQALQVPRLGRYVALKLLEYLRRYQGLEVDAPDIRPKGGWSPRKTLAALWDKPEADAHNDSPETLALVNQLCVDTLKRLKREHGVKLDLFQLQVMLCEYRESWEGERQYPGRSIDSELKYALKAEELWGYKSEIWEARKKLFPHQHLGELNGWTGPRDGPASALAHHRYTWTDLVYDFNQTHDFAHPTKYGAVPVPASEKPIKHQRSRKRTTVYTVLDGKLYQSGRWTQMETLECERLADELQLDGIVNLWKDDPRLGKIVKWYRWWPLPDGKTIPPIVEMIADEVLVQLRAGKRILTMCYGGRNRSGLISALSVQGLLECTGAKAFDTVKSARKGALVNAHFEAFLKQRKKQNWLVK